MTRQRLILLSLAATAATLLHAGSTPAKGRISADHYQETVKFLASDAMKGRGTGTPQLKKAAAYIAGQFKALGIPPAAGNSYYQIFDVTTNARLAKGNELSYAVGGGKKQAASLGQEFNPYNFSGNAKVSGPVVFAGYGITAPEYDYDDYAGLDVQGKIVLVLRHEPQEFDEKSKFGGKVYTVHEQRQTKAVNAKFHGAKAVLFVNDMSNHPVDSDVVDKFSNNVGPNSPDIPFIQVKTELASHWLQPSGKNLKDWIEAVDKNLKPASFEIPGLTVDLAVNVQREVRQVPNVAAYLKGETDEYVILGAHFDHLGMGEQSSMAPDLAGKAIHHGADDNASGTAGLLELADYFAAQPKRKRGILFLAFSAEELGLIGSSYYVNHPLLPLDKAVTMINMDMIGRIKDGRVFVGGTGTGSTLLSILDETKPAHPRLKLDLSEQGGYGSSDHFSFTIKQVPVLFFFSGLHSDYHKPSDTWEKIDHVEAADLVNLVAEVTTRLQDAPRRPTYVKVSTPAPAATATASASGGGAWFGSVPDMGETKGGFKISDVTKGSPADVAGLKGGDLIVEFDGKTISNLYDFTYALRSKKPGDVVPIKYNRDGKILETKATLKSRSQMR
ncbi:M20/M25/M40 family metallo-hydrolase [uncultured Paludibaculum sp.]|uniref:M20/M25/M40 family metallo-hydrolase n=1 Tax=uncultured Paludibaculum sp. TaxID=1765020 RepID=UPI002AAC266F|nr:M20/M25/M40 family metallo-hydrolase [uncultured Paludibaculum sp.]